MPVLRRQVEIASKTSDGEWSGALPECADIGQDVESTPGLWRIDHRRGMIGVPKTKSARMPGAITAVYAAMIDKLLDQGHVANLTIATAQSGVEVSSYASAQRRPPRPAADVG